jgi:perosamine synthetase
MDVGELRRICDTNEITAVVAIHNYGYMCDMKEVSEICQSYKLFLIEDCSEAIGSSFNGIAAGLFGDVATFSFFANKNITCGEGGAVHFKRTIDAKLARDISNHCVIDKTGMTTNGLGFNFRLSSILGAILLVQVKRLPRVLRKKKRVLEWYRQELSEVPVVFQNMITGNCGVPWLVNIKFSSKDLRDNVLAGLEANGVEVRKIFPPLAQEFYGKHINFAASNNAREIYDTWLSLPSYPDISRKDVRRISKVIKCQVTKNQLTRDQSIN